jgi:hypothetical protein
MLLSGIRILVKILTRVRMTVRAMHLRFLPTERKVLRLRQKPKMLRVNAASVKATGSLGAVPFAVA